MAKPQASTFEAGRCACRAPAALVVRVLIEGQWRTYRFCPRHRGEGSTALAMVLNRDRLADVIDAVNARQRIVAHGTPP